MGETGPGQAGAATDPRGRLELILGGQRSGKSRLAEQRGLDWLGSHPGCRTRFIATALAADDEMAERIARHRSGRPASFATCEAPWDLAAALRDDDGADHLRVVDCLTLWVTNWLMPAPSVTPPGDWPGARRAFIETLAACRGPVILVSNEIGLGVTPLGRESRRFVDEMGGLHRDVAALADRVTLVVAGLEVTVK